MHLFNIIPGNQKIVSEKTELKEMSKIPFLNKLLDRLSAPQNTNVKFEGKYVNFDVNTIALGKLLLSSVYKSELSFCGSENNPEKAESRKKEINDGIKKWFTQEKSIIPVNIIKREVDLMHTEHKIKTIPKNLDKIIVNIEKMHFGSNSLGKDGVNCSTMSVLKLNKHLTDKINGTGIKQELDCDFTKNMPAMTDNLKKELNKYIKGDLSDDQKKELTEKYAEYKKHILEDHDNLTTIMTGRIQSDIYYALTENIYNTLLCDKYTETPRDFNAIKKEIREQVILLDIEAKAEEAEKTKKAENAKETEKTEKKEQMPPVVPDNSININDIVYRAFDFKTHVTTSYPEQDITHVMDILKRMS